MPCSEWLHQEMEAAIRNSNLTDLESKSAIVLICVLSWLASPWCLPPIGDQMEGKMTKRTVLIGDQRPNRHQRRRVSMIGVAFNQTLEFNVIVFLSRACDVIATRRTR